MVANLFDGVEEKTAPMEQALEKRLTYHKTVARPVDTKAERTSEHADSTTLSAQAWLVCLSWTAHIKLEYAIRPGADQIEH